MESKNTNQTQNAIGKFISALRRANGMTQKELGERLYVSDKTVSRWERGECDPELSLIPAIAEIFGITTDELLRGVRNPQRETDPAESEEMTERRAARGDKQFRAMLHGRLLRYRNLSMISVGLVLTGLLTAMLFNLALTSGMIGFCLGTAFLVASVICQICFASSARMAEEPDGERYVEELREANTVVTETLLKVLLLGAAAFAFLVPIGFMTKPYQGLVFAYWLFYGGIFAAATLILLLLLYVFILRDVLIRRGLLWYDEARSRCAAFEKTLLKRITAVGGAVAVVLAVSLAAMPSYGAKPFAYREVFTSYEEFKAYTEKHKHDRVSAVGGSIYLFENVTVEIVPDSVITVDPNQIVGTDTSSDAPIARIEDENGNVLCEYVHNSAYIASVEYSFDKSEDGLPVKVITRAAMNVAWRIYAWVRNAHILLITVDVVVCALVFVRRTKKYRLSQAVEA